MNCTWTREQSVDPCVSLLSARGTVFFDARSLYCSMLANTFDGIFFFNNENTPSLRHTLSHGIGVQYQSISLSIDASPVSALGSCGDVSLKSRTQIGQSRIT